MNPTLRPFQLEVKDVEKVLPPIRTLKTAAKLPGVLAIGPVLSNKGLAGLIPSMDTLSTEILMQYRAARPEGWTKDPSVSAPIDTGPNPVATPTALPDEDPAGV